MEVKQYDANPKDVDLDDVSFDYIGDFISKKGRVIKFAPIGENIRGEVSVGDGLVDPSPAMAAIGKMPGMRISISLKRNLFVITDMLAEPENRGLREAITSAANTESMGFQSVGYVYGPRVFKLVKAEQLGTLLWTLRQLHETGRLRDVKNETMKKADIEAAYPVVLSETMGVAEINGDKLWNIAGKKEDYGTPLSLSKKKAGNSHNRTPPVGGNQQQ